MITIKTHLNYLEEIKWLSQVIFEEILGLNYILEIHDEEDFKVITNEKEIVLENFFLKNQKKKWLKPFSFKEMSIKYINLFDCFNREFYQDNLPVIFGNPNIKIFKNKYIFNFDVLGTIFFFLSDYESACSPYKDKHERFEFKNSILSKEDLIYRPIVDEYIEILMHAIKVLNPSLNPIKTKSKLSISCDVDNPYNEYTKSFILTLKKCAGDILKRKSSKDFFITLTNYFLSKLGVYIFDDLFNFNWMMDEAEKNKLKINFFFIFLKSDKQMDGYYSLNEKALMDLLLNIHHRKHIIGIHSSYKTAKLEIENYNKLGVKNFLVAPPFFFKELHKNALESWFINLFNSISNQNSILLYNIPQITKIRIDAELIRRLQDQFSKNFVKGVKDSSGDIEQTNKYLKHNSIVTTVGDERLIAKALKLGGDGSICGLSNIYPKEILNIIENKQENPSINKIVNKILNFPVVPAIKTLLYLKTENKIWLNVRPPLIKSSNEIKDKLKKII